MKRFLYTGRSPYFIFILILIFYISPYKGNCQTQQQWIKYAEKSFAEKDYYGASIYYKEAMKADSTNTLVVYKYAESLKLVHDYKLAEKYYQKVFETDRGFNFTDALFWMALMQKNNAKYIEARKNFMAFNKSFRDKNSYFFKKSQQEIKSCEYALTLIKNPVKAIIYNIGDSVNSVNSEFAAIRINDSVIYYSSLQYKHLLENNCVKDKECMTTIFKAEKIDTLWMRKNKLDSAINKAAFHNANGSFSPDGKRFYFSRCDLDMKCQIYVSDVDQDNFKTAIPLNGKINLINSTNTQPNIANIDGTEYLFFVSDRSGGQGGLDIWYSKKVKGEFSQPINAGPEINSIEYEVSPYYDSTKSELCFSSPWHYGLGGFDVFKSKGKPGSFTKPENIGYPLNSSANDLYYSQDSLNGFLTSNRIGSITKENETCCNDIWAFRMIPEKPAVDTTPVVVAKPNPLKELQKFMPIKLYFHNDEPNPKTKDTITQLSYYDTYLEYRKLIPDYKENYSKGLIDEKKQIAEDTIDSFFKNYAEDNFQRLQEFTEVLIKQMEKGYKLDLTVKGHASPLANSDYNVNLTLRRISSLENYLKEYKGGILKPYLLDSAANGGSLRIIKVPFGEYQSEEFVSDNLNDKKSSVYSISAALNRNIEIVSVALETQDSLRSRIYLRKEVFDFKEIKSGAVVSYTFRFKNIGKAPLNIMGVEPSCSCITAQSTVAPVAPGESGEVKVTFDSSGLKGRKVHTVTLLTNGIPERKELSITAEVK